MKLRKILSLVLAAALLCTVCFIGGVSAEASAVVKEDGNYILNGSFELAETKDNGEVYGYESYCVNHGGTGIVVDNWKTFNWLNGNSAANPNIKITHTTDAHTGDYALYFDIPYGNTHYTYPSALAVDELPVGNYRLTAWVKGTNSASTINVTDADGNVKSVNVVASEDWTQISIDGITSIGTVTIGSNDAIGITITPKMGDAASYFIIDDIRLEAVEAPEEALLEGGSFEATSELWQTDPGYTDKGVGKGQVNKLANGWGGLNWYDDSTLRTFVDHTTDAYDGDYALKFKFPSTSATMYFYPDNDYLNTEAITAGYYTLSFWVKGTNTSSKVEVTSTTADGTTAKIYSKTNIPATEEWQQINIYDIYLTDNASNLATYRQDGTNNMLGYKIIFTLISSAESYLILDGVTLTKQEPFYNGGMEIDGTGTSNTVANGQANPNSILQGYTIIDYTERKTTYDIVDDAHSGNQAIKITYNGEGTVYSRHDGNDIGAGIYRISAWVKGNATNAYFRIYQATTDAPTTEINDGKYKRNPAIGELSETEWKYVEEIFTVYEGHMIQKAYEKDQTLVYYNKLGFGINAGDAGSYAIFDDVKLEKLDDAATAAASIIGIDAPEKGATTLTLPEVDDSITLSIAASSDESIVALDGTITPPAGRTQVDITLSVSDGTNTVTLDPIGVVIPGTEQLDIDAVEYAIKRLPNGNDGNYQLPIHYADAVAAREMYNALSDEAKPFVSNITVLGERDGVLNKYSAVIDAASTKNDKLRIKAGYPLSIEVAEGYGYTVKEYGMLFIPSALVEDENITLDTENVAKSVMTQLPGEADASFYSILNGSENHPDVEILMRSYVTYEYTENDEVKIVTLYGRNVVKSSAGALAQ